ncbi:MAG: hypothetical protein JWM28_574 [Chitinophagaceae bacterium]|nr:hypothetical protein [Chitinophagaceae bacterium]
MTSSILKPVIAKMMFFILSFITVFSLSSKAGGIVFEIYLNNKLLLKQQYNKVISGSPELQLDETNRNDNLRIFFTSCGASGKTRSVGIRDENNKLLKEWTFTNSSSSDLFMTIPVKEILALQKNKSNASLKLYYFSPEQFPDGQMLASVQSGKKSVAWIDQKGVPTADFRF